MSNPSMSNMQYSILGRSSEASCGVLPMIERAVKGVVLDESKSHVESFAIQKTSQDAIILNSLDAHPKLRISFGGPSVIT